MLSALLLKKKITSTIPFLGEVTSANFIDGVSLASAIGLSIGTAINTATNWLKFSYNGKTLYVPKLPVRQGVSWTSIYNAKAVYGSGGTGDPIPSGQSAVAQTAQVTIASHIYKVRLLQGFLANPVPGPVNGTDTAATVGSEWNNLFYPIVTDSHITTYSGSKIASPYALIDLGFDASLTGYNEWVANVLSGSGYTTTAGIRGNTSTIANCAQQTYTSGGGTAAYGWRPCLEFVS